MKKAIFLAMILALSSSFVIGQTYKVLWSFGGAPNDGSNPVGNLVADKAGNLYGTTKWGGSGTNSQCAHLGCGTVFELSPNSDGTWTSVVLYNFCATYLTGVCLDGQFPTAGLAFDAAGNLYGTSYNGGAAACPDDSAGCGTVFELSPPPAPGGDWTETVLYSFCSVEGNNCLDGDFPNSHLTLDSSGNLYGTTSSGGNGGWFGGTVFELSPGQNGWAETILYNFCTNGTYLHCTDGTNPQAGVTFDNAGNLYGTTESGGTPKGGGAGVVFKLAPESGSWTESVLVAFNPAQGLASPRGVVSFDTAGNLYSTAYSGGPQVVGGVFRLNPNSNFLRGFAFNGNNGAQPTAGVLVDSKTGSIYGTTYGSPGTVFKIGKLGNESPLYVFCQQQSCADGEQPYANVIEYSGHLFGTTTKGGANGFGVVFELTP